MKILTSAQIRSADAYTIANEPVASIDLMERAATACTAWIKEHLQIHTPIQVFCGPGNNGGDGLAIARQLLKAGYKCHVFIIRSGEKYSTDFLENERRLIESFPDEVNEIKREDDLPLTGDGDVVIDALFGTGLTRPLEGLYAKVIDHINRSRAEIIAIDVCSGLFADVLTPGDVIVHATHTLTFQAPKLAFMYPENGKFVGEFHVLDIGLDRKFIDEQ